MDTIGAAPSGATRRPVAARLGLALAGLALLAGCGLATPARPGGPAGSSASPSAGPSGGPPLAFPSTSPDGPSDASATPDPLAELCERFGEVRVELTELLAVPRRVAYRDVLDGELAELEAAFAGLVRADRGPVEDALERPMRELGYRMTDVTLAVEDYRTTRRPSEAAEHIERQGVAFSATLDSIERLAGCRE